MRIACSIDDGSKLDMAAAELMKKYDIPTIFYIPVRWQRVNAIKNRPSLSQAEFEAIAAEFEIGSHTINHHLLTRVEPELAEFEIRRSRELLREMTGQDVNSFCYPRGYYSYEIKQQVEACGYTNARTVQVGYLTEPEDPYLTHTTVHVGYNRKEYDGKTWFEYALEKLAEAQEEDDSVYRLWFHSWEVEENQAWEDLEELLRLTT